MEDPDKGRSIIDPGVGSLYFESAFPPERESPTGQGIGRVF